MVVCENGEMAKPEYRRFRIRAHDGQPNDPAMMREVLARRLAEAKKGSRKFSKLPDLIIVDGGKGQVTAAASAIEQQGYRLPGPSARLGPVPTNAEGAAMLPLCGLAKRFELLILPGEPDPVVLPRDSQALYLVQRIRDEAHRFANAYRSLLQGKARSRSLLDDIPGIGPKRRRELLRRFGSLDAIRAASEDDLASAPTMNRLSASKVYAFFHR
jgi:excinuclease ABC subunit C